MAYNKYIQLLHLIDRHVKSRLAIEHFLATSSEFPNIEPYTKCFLSKWCATEGAALFGHRADFQILLDAHEQFHKIVDILLSAKAENNKVVANQYAEAYTEYSTKLIIILHKYLNELHQQMLET